MSFDDAIDDMKYLLNRGYKKKTALNFVSNHYGLDRKGRNFLLRYVFSDRDIEEHKSKLVPIESIRGRDVVIDGYNVLVTVETILNNGKVVRGMDGFLRDTSGVFSKYRFDKNTKNAINSILDMLKKYKPRHILFIFDSQISMSGELAGYVRKKLREFDLEGDAKTSRSADHAIVSLNKIIMSTDSIIIRKVNCIVDIGNEILRERNRV